jgi:hypothetical protein
MIPKRYGNLYHTIKVIAFEEGPKGLWRGFTLNSLQVILRIKFLEIVLNNKVNPH